MTLGFRSFLSLILFTFMAVVCSGCGGGGTSETPAPSMAELAVYNMRATDVPIVAEFVGQTKGAVDADVRARVEGVILKMHFKEGTSVEEGALLYEIDPQPYQAKLAAAEAALAEANTRLVRAQADLKRIRPLAEMNAVSKRDLDSAIAAEGVAKSGVDAAEAGVESARIELGYCKVTAPVSGLIGLTKARVGEFVGRPPNAVVLNTISQLDPMHVRFTVTEKDYLYFARLRQKREKEGVQAPPRVLELILSDNSVHPEKGHLYSVDSQIDPSTGSLSAEAAFPNPGMILRPGQFAKVRTVRETLSGVFLLPKKSIRELQGLMQVTIVNPDHTAALKTVVLGAEVGNQVVITEGLHEGDLVVAEPTGRIKEGVKFTPKIIEISEQ